MYREIFAAFRVRICSLKEAASYDTMLQCRTKARLGTLHESSELPLGLRA
jgi:hypothetical protein